MSWVNITDLYTLGQLVDLSSTFGVSIDDDGFIVGNGAYVDTENNFSLLNMGAGFPTTLTRVRAVKFNVVYWQERFAPGATPIMSAFSRIAFPTGTFDSIQINGASNGGLAQSMIPGNGMSEDRSHPFIGVTFGFARTTTPSVGPQILTDFKIQILFYIDPPIPSEPEPTVTKNDPTPSANTGEVFSAAFICIPEN